MLRNSRIGFGNLMLEQASVITAKAGPGCGGLI
jgi:hypothetical protein